MRRQVQNVGVVLLLAISLAACATRAPQGADTAASVPVKAAPGTMEPIANPPEARLLRSPPPRAHARSPRPRTAPAKPVRAAADPKKASLLRAAGLEQLNRGAVDRAKALLQEAHTLDPGNPLIRRDLDRAARLSNALRGKS